MDQVEFYLSGLLLNSLCLFGLIANLLTLYVLNATREMRRQPINMFLSVLAIYDKGVLLNAILMCGIPALSKSATNHNLSNNLVNNDLNNLTTMPLHKDLNRTSRSAKSTDGQLDDEWWIDLYNSNDYDFLIDSRSIDGQSNRSSLVDLLNLSNSSRMLIFLNQSEAMAQQIEKGLFDNLTDLSITDSNANSTILTGNQPFVIYSTFGYVMHRVASFFAGHIQIIYPLANISQTGSIWITCLITGRFLFFF